ncbi:protein of unknown function [Pararobbsia alpina]
MNEQEAMTRIHASAPHDSADHTPANRGMTSRSVGRILGMWGANDQSTFLDAVISRSDEREKAKRLRSANALLDQCDV